MRMLEISLAGAAAIAFTVAATGPSVAAPLPTNIRTIKSMLPMNLTEVRWYGWRGGWGYRGWGRPWGWGAAATGVLSTTSPGFEFTWSIGCTTLTNALGPVPPWRMSGAEPATSTFGPDPPTMTVGPPPAARRF